MTAYTLGSPYVGGKPQTLAAINEETVPAYLWPGGYAAEYHTADCAILCAACVRRAYTDEHDPDHENAVAGKIYGPLEAHDESEDQSGIQCEGCNNWIVEPEPAE